MPIVDLIGDSYELKQRNLSSQRTINWYVENYSEVEGTKTKIAMVPTPGADKLMNIGGSRDRCRGLYWASTGPAPEYKPRLYGVWGVNVYRFNQNLTDAIQIGTIGDTGIPVTMADNGFVFAIADGENIYTYELLADDYIDESWKQIELPIVPGSDDDGGPGVKIQPTHIAYMALGYRFVINGRNTNKWFYSNLASKDVTFGQADFYSNVTADNILALKIVNGDLWLQNFRSYAIFKTNDNQDNPFSYVGGSPSQIGILAPYSMATIENKTFWLGASDVGASGIYMGESMSIKRVSTMGIENQIASLPDKENAIGWCYSSDGNIFYILSFPSSNRTFVYEATTNRFHERMLRDIPTGNWEVYNYQWGVQVNGDIYCGLINHENALVKLNPDNYTEWDGRIIVRQRVSPVYYDSLDTIQLKEFIIDMEVGTTPYLTGEGSDPKIVLDVSKDGSYTWGNSKPKSIGKQGKYRTKVRWFALGTGAEVAMRVTISEPLPCTIYQARLDFEKCGRN